MDEEERKGSMFIATSVSHSLPRDVIIEILSWLPILVLLKFKCVCKSWYSIISSSEFISKHLSNYYNKTDSWGKCLLVHYYESQAELTLYALLVDDTFRVFWKKELDNLPIGRCYVCGPCNGIYYLYNYYERRRGLWNPATREFKPLPDIIYKPHLPSNITYALIEWYGLGLDPITGDYKVVVIKAYWSTEEDDGPDDVDVHPLSVFVYSLRTDSWRYCGDLARDYRLEVGKCYMHVNGCYFWFASSLRYSKSSCEVIVSFDMATDVCEEMDAPDYAKPSSKCLGIYDDSLAFLSLHETRKILDIWTWKEGSWTKKFTTNPLPHIWNPIGHWRENYILLESTDCKLILIDPISQQLKDLGFQFLHCHGVFAFMASLVSLKDGQMILPPSLID